MKIPEKIPPLTTGEILSIARVKIRNEKNWLKGQSTEKSNGDFAHPSSAKACKWCALGAVRSVFKEGTEEHSFDTAMDEHMFQTAMFTLSKFTDCKNIAAFNDHSETTHADIIAVFDKAIAAIDPYL